MLKKLAMIFALVAVVITFTACEEDTTEPTVEEPKPNPVTNFQATSVNDSTIALKWVASTSENDELFDGYYLNVENTIGTIYSETKVNPLGENEYLKIPGLIDATEYTFSIYAKFTNDSVSSIATVKWATADRFELNFDEDPIRVYEAVSSFGSGLDLYNEDDEAPATFTVDNAALWDLGINTSGDKLIFGSAAKLGFSSVTSDNINAVTEIAVGMPYICDNLNDVFDSEALNTKQFAEDVIDLSPFSSSFVIVARRLDPNTQKYNYAKILIKNVNGQYLQGEAPNRYVEFEISYQKEQDLPYAKTK